MCWVIPPNSESTTDECLKESNKVVFPWSTCPIIVITGRLFTRSAGLGGGLKIIVS